MYVSLRILLHCVTNSGNINSTWGGFICDICDLKLLGTSVFRYMRETKLIPFNDTKHRFKVTIN